MFPLIVDAVLTPETAVAAGDEPRTRDAAVLAGSATLAIGAWGAAIHASDGLLALAGGALDAVAAAAGAWLLAVPSLVVVGALSGSTLSWRRTLYATLVTVNFGGLCFLASVPIIGLMEATWASGGWDPRLLINGLVVLGIGFSSLVVFLRTMGALEPVGLRHLLWIGLFGGLFLEFAALGGLTSF